MKTLLTLVYIVSLATACLITNCPKGGKRAFHSFLGKLVNKMPLQDIPSQCIKCGPGDEGHCVGAQVCCGSQIGCLMTSPGVVSQCSGFSIPPTATPTCLMSTGIGICPVDGICCNSESCRIETSCQADPYFNFCEEYVAQS